ncbi:MAG: hypothetical protein IPJ20_03235 [Flammeovirgaceae bacterium]|nr:hypothetical protein [Flammeovirgaceae bacterium]
MVLLSASYPAYLSKSFKIRELLSKSNLLKSNKTSQWSFTSFQLSVSVILIIWGFIIYSQVTFLLTKDLGFEKENLLTINAPIFESTHFETDVEVLRIG